MTLKPEDRALALALEMFPDEVTHDYDTPPGVPKHPAGKIVTDRGDLRFAFVAGFKAAREESRPAPRPSPVGREEVAQVIASALGDDFDHAFVNKSEWNKARGEKGGRYRDINEPMQDDYLAASDAILALIQGGWEPIETAPKDGTLILACQMPDEGRIWFKTWEQWKGPQTVAWRGYHVNAPGKATWRDAKGSPVVPDLWMPLDALAVRGAARD